ncbi:MAG: M42 family peptidase, partial [Clostridia bacterium]|nr:M42 family peptidase [Clostridia bacterium]
TVWGREPILGVFTIMPPHLKKSPDSSVRSVEEQAIDVGYSYGEVQKKVSIGDKVTFRSPLTILKGNCVSTSGLDNLAGVAVMLALAEKLVSYKHLSKTVVLQFSNFEETGHRYAGAVTGAFAAKPTQAIVIDASFAKTPGLNYPTPGTLGGGVMIGFSPMLSAKMSRSLRDLATQHQIPYTEEVMGGTSGTNADGIQSSCFGVPTALLSYPLKNMHTPVEVIDKTDLDHMVHLLDLYISKGGVISELC